MIMMKQILDKMENNDFKTFKDSINKVKGTRNHTIKDSYGVLDYYNHYKKNKKKHIDKPTFLKIIRKINILLGEELLENDMINFPKRMGRVYILRKNPAFNIVDGHLRTNVKVNWFETLKLWHEDEEAKKNKTTIKYEPKYIFKIIYNTFYKFCSYKNKSCFDFNLNRTLLLRMYKKADKGELQGVTNRRYNKQIIKASKINI